MPGRSIAQAQSRKALRSVDITMAPRRIGKVGLKFWRRRGMTYPATAAITSEKSVVDVYALKHVGLAVDSRTSCLRDAGTDAGRRVERGDPSAPARQRSQYALGTSSTPSGRERLIFARSRRPGRNENAAIASSIAVSVRIWPRVAPGRRASCRPVTPFVPRSRTPVSGGCKAMATLIRQLRGAPC